MRFRNNIKIYLGLLLSVILLAGFYFFFDPFLKDESYEASRFDIFDSLSFEEDLKVEGVSADICDDNHAIEYLYYAELPEEPRNNKFGLYVYAENRDFIRLASQLVNSNGGEWGYVLIPYNVHDYDRGKWDGVFSLLEEEKLIPIIQLNDVDPNNYEKQTRDSAQFLNSFVWPIKQRYISVYNEPNDARFWYGRVDPDEYAEILDYTIDIFKEENPNFFMMNGAFNVSAGRVTGYMDAFDYMKSMHRAVPGVFSKLDGWASHPYPQPEFSGSPLSTGRNSIRAYESELYFLKNSLGVEKDLPVFITETGWLRAEGEVNNPRYLSAEQVAKNFEVAYSQVWLPDDRVVAVMPFTIWYSPPFDHFSWIDKNKEPYPQFRAVEAMAKVAGTPQALTRGKVLPEGCE